MIIIILRTDRILKTKERQDLNKLSLKGELGVFTRVGPFNQLDDYAIGEFDANLVKQRVP